MKKVHIVLLGTILVLLLYYVREHFTQSTYKVDTFNKNQFLNSMKHKNVIVCGNSTKFPEAFSKITTTNTFIIRFNTVLDHIQTDSKTDVLFVSKELLQDYTIQSFNIWKDKCKQCNIFYIDMLRKDNTVLDQLEHGNTVNYTSGFIVLCFLCSYIHLFKSVTLVGFDLPNDYNTPVNWYRNNALFKGHDIDVEKQLLSGLLKKYNVNKI
jgi:hypothetical protein